MIHPHVGVCLKSEYTFMYYFINFSHFSSDDRAEEQLQLQRGQHSRVQDSRIGRRSLGGIIFLKSIIIFL